jgi:ligand-binding sensor domain-containing protein
VNYWQDDSLYSLERLSALDNQRVISIFEDSNEEIWFGTDGAGAWLFEQDEQLIQYSTSQGF